MSREFIEAGGLFAYGPSYPNLYRRAASYVDRIIKGEQPGDLPIEQPTKFELIVNLSRESNRADNNTNVPVSSRRGDRITEWACGCAEPFASSDFVLWKYILVPAAMHSRRPLWVTG